MIPESGLMVRIKRLLKKHEGLRLMPYKDTVGKLTIGYGRNLDDKGVSNVEADIMLSNDVTDAYVEARDSFPWFKDLTDVRQNVIVNMVYNMGLYKFKGFKQTIRLIEKESYTAAALEMLDSRWAVQVGARADELSKMMKDG